MEGRAGKKRKGEMGEEKSGRERENGVGEG